MKMVHDSRFEIPKNTKLKKLPFLRYCIQKVLQNATLVVEPKWPPLKFEDS